MWSRGKVTDSVSEGAQTGSKSVSEFGVSSSSALPGCEDDFPMITGNVSKQGEQHELHILESLEDFKREMVSGVCPLSPSAGADGVRGHTENPSSALLHWSSNMMQRRRQQHVLSQALQKPVGSLLMTRSSGFRQKQEDKELISRADHEVCGFWNLPDHFGDELSGITATLTRSQRGDPPTLTRIRQPLATRMESGNVCDEAVYGAWTRSLYLQQRRVELKHMLEDFSPAELDGLEVLGSRLPPVGETVSLVDTEEEENDDETDRTQKETQDVLTDNDVISKACPLPALRIAGELVHWADSGSTQQDVVGVAWLLMETEAGTSVSSELELRNEGSSVIYYNWKRLKPAYTHTHFYFNTSTAFICPGSSRIISVEFVRASAGVVTEIWCLNTHPKLMGGASLQVTLRGVASFQDKSALQRAALQEELQKEVGVSTCRSMVLELLKGVCTPERPRSPVDRDLVEEHLFCKHNPQLQYNGEAVAGLKSLWQQANSSQDVGNQDQWNMSLRSLLQALMSLPDTDDPITEDDAEQTEPIKEKLLSEYNSLILTLQQPQTQATPPTAHNISRQLWREVLECIVVESETLKHTLELHDDNNTRSQTALNQIEEKKELCGDTREIQNKERYRVWLHSKVLFVMEKMVDSLCDLCEDAQQ